MYSLYLFSKVVKTTCENGEQTSPLCIRDFLTEPRITLHTRIGGICVEFYFLTFAKKKTLNFVLDLAS